MIVIEIDGFVTQAGIVSVQAVVYSACCVFVGLSKIKCQRINFQSIKSGIR